MDESNHLVYFLLLKVVLCIFNDGSSFQRQNTSGILQYWNSFDPGQNFDSFSELSSKESKDAKAE